MKSPPQEMGLAFDEWDLDYYTQLFKGTMGRDPTNVELFDIAQSNSEHSRHWFFRCGGGGRRGAGACQRRRRLLRARAAQRRPPDRRSPSSSLPLLPGAIPLPSF